MLVVVKANTIGNPRTRKKNKYVRDLKWNDWQKSYDIHIPMMIKSQHTSTAVAAVMSARGLGQVALFTPNFEARSAELLHLLVGEISGARRARTSQDGQ